MKKSVVFLVVIVILTVLAISASASAGPPSVFVPTLEPTWSAGVFSAYMGPPDYNYASPGSTAKYLGRQAGIIKAGLAVDPIDGHYWDQGLFAFNPAVTIDQLASRPLTYVVVNQYGTNPVWMSIQLDTGVLGDPSDNTNYQFVPAPYGSAAYSTVNAGAGLWVKWNDLMGDTTENPYLPLSQVAGLYPGAPVVGVYLRLGMGDSYAGTGQGTVAWVDKATIAGVTYDFVVRGKGFHKKDWATNPGGRPHYISPTP
jgi:hypothetical protein